MLHFDEIKLIWCVCLISRNVKIRKKYIFYTEKEENCRDSNNTHEITQHWGVQHDSHCSEFPTASSTQTSLLFSQQQFKKTPWMTIHGQKPQFLSHHHWVNKPKQTRHRVLYSHVASATPAGASRGLGSTHSSIRLPAGHRTWPGSPECA